MPRSLVTGATGFVGSNLVETLLGLGWDVRCLVRDPGRAQHLADRGAELIVGSLQNFEAVEQAVDGVEFVFHLAGRTAAVRRHQFFDDNVTGSQTVIEACARQVPAPTVVMVSSLAAGGPSVAGAARRETDPDEPISAYGMSKLAAEASMAAFASQVPLSIVRPPVVFGPRDKASLTLFAGVDRWRLHANPGFRRMPLSVVYVKDLCQALVLVAEGGKRIQAAAGQDASRDGIYYVTSAPVITYPELGRLASRALKRRVLVLPLPVLIFWMVGAGGELLARVRGRAVLVNLDKVREACARGWVCSDQRLRDEVGYNPTGTLQEQFDETAKWYREHGWL